MGAPKGALMKLRAALVAVAVLLPVVPAAVPVAQAHNCTKEEPRCVDYRTLVEKPERQEIISRVLGHHCYMDGLGEEERQRDKRVLLSRIGVVFSNVTRESGYFETVTIYFEGDERQIMGSVDAAGKQNDFSKYDDQGYDPGFNVSFRVDKQVRFYQQKDGPNYTIRHEGAAGKFTAGPSGGPRGRQANRPDTDADCAQAEHLILLVRPPSTPKCQRPPCEPQ